MRPIVRRLAVTIFLLAIPAYAADHRLRASPETIAWGYYARGGAQVRPPASSRRHGDHRHDDHQQSRAADRGGSEARGLDQNCARSTKSEGQGSRRTHPDRAHLYRGRANRRCARGPDRRSDLPNPVRVQWLRAGPRFSTGGISKARTRIIPFDLKRGWLSSPGNIESADGTRSSAAWASLRRRPPGRISSAPPGIHAGNLDNKELVAGTTLFISGPRARRAVRGRRRPRGHRVTARWTSPRWKRRSPARFSSSCARTCI